MKVGLLGILTIIFIVSKLAHIIDWSWWLVLLPMYGGIVLGLFAVVAAAFLAAWAEK